MKRFLDPQEFYAVALDPIVSVHGVIRRGTRFVITGVYTEHSSKAVAYVTAIIAADGQPRVIQLIAGEFERCDAAKPRGEGKT